METNKTKMKIAIFSDDSNINKYINSLREIGQEVYLFNVGSKNFIDEENNLIYVHNFININNFKYLNLPLFNHKFILECSKLSLDLILVDIGSSLTNFAFKLSKALAVPLISRFSKYSLEQVSSNSLVRFCNNSSEVIAFDEGTKKQIESNKNIKTKVTCLAKGIDFDSLNFSKKDIKEITINLMEKYKIIGNSKVIVIFTELLNEESAKTMFKYINFFELSDPKYKVKFWFVGKTNPSLKLKELEEKYNTSRYIKVINLDEEDPIEFCLLSDACLFIGDLDYTEKILKEAMYLKNVCLVNHEGIIEDGVNGFTYKNVDEFIIKLNKILKINSTAKAQLQSKAFEALNEYSLDNYLKRTMIIYSQVVRKEF